MKLKVTFKTPDALSMAVEDLGGITDDDLVDINELSEEYIRWDEYITVEFDTVAKTCVVCKNDQ